MGKKSILVVMLTLVLAQCGGSPTSPSAKPSAAMPPHQPANIIGSGWHGKTTYTGWMGPSVLPETFDIQWSENTLWLGTVTADIFIMGSDNIFARLPGAKIQVVWTDATHATWAYSGFAGQAYGTVEWY